MTSVPNKILASLLALTLIFGTQCLAGEGKTPADYVNPFIGTGYHGHTYPGATLPFGMVQASPDTGLTHLQDWDHCSGYHYDDDILQGFSQTHLCGTGVGDLADLLIQPFTGDPMDGAEDYYSKFRHETESAAPGYYAVTVDKFQTKVQITCSLRTAFYSISYPSGEKARLMVDYQSAIGGIEDHRVKDCTIEYPDAYTIVGQMRRNGWVGREFAFAMRFNKPILEKKDLERRGKEEGGRVALNFGPVDGENLMVKVSVSGVDKEGALKNLEAEIKGWNFEAQREKAFACWNSYLKRAEVLEGSDDQKANFYTGIYHAFINPNVISDVDGRYRRPDHKIAKTEIPVYSTFSQWDTFRAANPLHTILVPELVKPFVNSMLIQQKVIGYLPVWQLWGYDNQCMIGTHSVPFLADACLKGYIEDQEEVFNAIRATLRVDNRWRARGHWRYVDKYGYFPTDKSSEATSETMECAYDDYCAAVLAKSLGQGHDEDRDFFENRCKSWRNVIDQSVGFARGRDSKGNWREPFDPTKVGGDFTEANAWQFTWHVMQDPNGLIDFLGGREKCLEKLNALFVQPTIDGRLSDVTGLIGEYAHGNEPSHHVTYFFQFLGEPRRTQELVREVCDRFYAPTPEGVCGNEDCGQMGAWFVFSAMGFYPFNPCGGEYVMGAPQIGKIAVTMPTGKVLTIEAKNLSAANKYVKKVTLNGEKVDGISLNHAKLCEGGELVFEMCE